MIVYANVTIRLLMQWSGCNWYQCCGTNCFQSHFTTQACNARSICANILACGDLVVHYKWKMLLLIVKTMIFWKCIYVPPQRWHWYRGLFGLSSPSCCMWSGAILVLLELFGCCLVPISLMSCMQIHLWTKTAPVNQPAPSQNAMQLARGQIRGMRKCG